MKKNAECVSRSPEWQALTEHFSLNQQISLKQLWNEDANRFQQYSARAAGILLDYSNNHCRHETISLLLKLAERAGLPDAIDALFSGQQVNVSENTPALHTALRNFSDKKLFINDGQHEILAPIRQTLSDMRFLSDRIRQGRYCGFSGEPLKHIVHIGIGGSHLGPEMVLQALSAVHPQADLDFHFVANLDVSEINHCLRRCHPENTLFIVASKSFRTRETLVNLRHALDWLRAAGADANAISQQVIAVSAAEVDSVFQPLLGDHTPPILCLPLWDWVSGRYSVWSAIGLSIAVAFGMSVFEDFLKGAHAMDLHLSTTDLAANLPVILGLLSVWYTNFFHCQSQAIIPYHQNLALLPAYLQQLHMESLGKRVSRTGEPLDYATGGVIWGGVGTNSQHSFHQLLLQGTHLIPCDFILPLKTPEHEAMVANCLAQSDVFTSGYEATGEHAQQQRIIGNRAHNLLMLDDIDASSLGALLALYEHKVYVQSVIWQINPFDQWGIQRGKQLALDIQRSLRARPQDQRLKMIAEKIYE